MYPAKTPNIASTSASGASYTTGIVLGIAGNVAQVRLSTGNQVVNVRTDMTRGKSAPVAAGDIWILDQPYGLGWMFAVCLGYQGTLSWTSATLLGAWHNFSTPGTWTPGSGLFAPASYLQDATGWVQLRGTVAGGTITGSSVAGPISADILQLPAGSRPASDGQLLFPTYAAGPGAVLVTPGGYVRAYAGTAIQVPLDGVRFLAAQ
jgi:hypothetical protein